MLDGCLARLVTITTYGLLVGMEEWMRPYTIPNDLAVCILKPQLLQEYTFVSHALFVKLVVVCIF